MSRSAPAALLALLLGLGGCVASPETKLASSQYKIALHAYTQDLQAFEAAWMTEIDRLLGDLGAALAAHAVTTSVRRLSREHDGFSSRAWQRHVAAGGLITLSAAIDDERSRVHELLEMLEAIPVDDDVEPPAAVDAVLAEYRRRAIAAIEAMPGLRGEEKQRLLVEAELGPFGTDPVANSIVRSFVTWRVTRDAIPRNINDLEAVLSALKQAHASIDRWIQTDVTVSGEDIATLVREWSVNVAAAR